MTTFIGIDIVNDETATKIAMTAFLNAVLTVTPQERGRNFTLSSVILSFRNIGRANVEKVIDTGFYTITQGDLHITNSIDIDWEDTFVLWPNVGLVNDNTWSKDNARRFKDYFTRHSHKQVYVARHSQDDADQVANGLERIKI